MTSEYVECAKSDSEDDFPVCSFKTERQTDGEGDELDLNMTVEAEDDETSVTNKIIIGMRGKHKKNKKKLSKIKKKLRKKGKKSRDNSVEMASEDVSSVNESDTEEVPIEEVPDVKPQPMYHKTHQFFKSFKFGSPPDRSNVSQLPEIKLPIGEPITVVTIKQEYDEDENEFLKDEHEVADEKPLIKEEMDHTNKSKGKYKKLKEELTEDDLLHMNIEFKFTCQLCNEQFPNSEGMRVHMEIHQEVGTYMCATCQRVYQNIEHLRSHMMCHIKGGRHKCDQCGKLYHHSQSLMAHRKRWHNRDRPFSCDACGKTFSLKNDLTTHMRSHSDDKFQCQYCDKSFRTDRYLRIHTRHIHLGHKYIRIECKVCHKSFQKKNLLTHMKLHQDKMHKCHYCGKTMTTAYSLMAHIRRHEGIKPFVCEICNKGFVDKGKLSRHIHSHRGTRDFQCDICEKSFSESQYLRQHKRTHDLSKEYPCRVCGAKFKSMNSVWSHMRKHTHTNRYECHFCGKTCYRPDHLRSHLVSHTGIKEFQCEICSKRFAKAYDLTEHRRGHSGERPYHCKLCNRAFARHGEFRKHKMSKYHREREIEAGIPPSYAPRAPRAAAPQSALPHHCDTCDKRFSTAAGLAAHMRRKSHLARTAAGVVQGVGHPIEEDREDSEQEDGPDAEINASIE